MLEEYHSLLHIFITCSRRLTSVTFTYYREPNLAYAVHRFLYMLVLRSNSLPVDDDDDGKFILKVSDPDMSELINVELSTRALSLLFT